MTPEDEFYFHFLSEMCPGDSVASWPLVRELVGLGQNLIDANLLANLANETIPITDQKRAAPILQTVRECAETLQVPAPPVHVDGEPQANAYVAGLKPPHVLVFTSGLLDLYEERPSELRFVIGHELGHIKAQHLKTHFLGSTLLQALLGDRGRSASFREDFIASAAVGTLLHWYRESEFTADRAGLLCVGGDAEIAQQALLRLQHQTKPSNRLFDPKHPNFDADLVLKNQLQLKNQPFVKVVSYLRQWRQTHPFIPERCAAIKNWSRSAEFHTIMERPKSPPAGRTLKVTSIQITGIPSVDYYVPGVDTGASDPFVKLTHGGVTQASSHVNDATQLNLSNASFTYDYSEGAGLIVELFDHNSVLAHGLIGATLLAIPPRRTSGTLTAELELDVLKEAKQAQRPVARIQYELQ